MDISIGDLRSFVTVAELESFQKAAFALNISQPALSRRVQKLEEMLGVQLLERTTRQISLSTVGRDFLPKAQRLIDELDTSLLSVREIAERASGQVSIACVPTAAYYFLPEVIKAFSADYPRIRVRIIDEGANMVLKSVLQGEADLGINLLGFDDPDIEFEPLLEERFVLACLHDHPLASKKTVEWAELAPYKLIAAGRLSGNRLIIDQGLSALTQRPRGLYEVQHLSTSLGMVEAGLGIAALPEMTMPRRPHPTLVSRPLVNPVLKRTMAIIRRRGTNLSPAGQSFYNILKLKWPKRGDADRVEEPYARDAGSVKSRRQQPGRRRVSRR
jgi:DNA-binding transcriptional LysR family regulator